MKHLIVIFIGILVFIGVFVMYIHTYRQGYNDALFDIAYKSLKNVNTNNGDDIYLEGLKCSGYALEMIK